MLAEAACKPAVLLNAAFCGWILQSGVVVYQSLQRPGPGLCEVSL